MLTFEKVLEIFADYLTADETIEVYISRHGCVLSLIHISAYQQDRDLLRFRYHRPREIWENLKDLDLPRRTFSSSRALRAALYSSNLLFADNGFLFNAIR